MVLFGLSGWVDFMSQTNAYDQTSMPCLNAKQFGKKVIRAGKHQGKGGKEERITSHMSDKALGKMHEKNPGLCKDF